LELVVVHDERERIVSALDSMIDEAFGMRDNVGASALCAARKMVSGLRVGE
jgi:hypothetical protein